MKNKSFFTSITLLFFACAILYSCAENESSQDAIPLIEHPRPDFERADWMNLNGYWKFEFDGKNSGESEQWYKGDKQFTHRILVPFPWGSALSEVENKADIAWYEKNITIPEDWQGKRVFLVVGASDWLTKGWLDGEPIGHYQGGYTPFEFELTENVHYGKVQKIHLRVDDSPHDFKLFGKQGYGDAKGIWQTVYLEARPKNFIKNFFFTPDIDREKINIKATFDTPLSDNTSLKLNYRGSDENYTIGETRVEKGQEKVSFDVDIPNPILWTLENPHLYNVELALQAETPDVIATYFGMRKIGIVNLPGTDIPYVALNDRPIYLQTALDQAYHPEGYYTFPSDEFIRDEIWRAKEIGLNGQRVHIKVPIPRKLYWADKLGHLIMADVPNSWGEPDEAMKQETKTALKGMINRDYNHPSVFSWVLFNETWGLFHKDDSTKRIYKPETQQWVSDMYALAKELDGTRLVEDNSPCHYDHVITDMNTWHAYLPGYSWKDFLDNVSDRTYVGSPWNFTGSNVQTNVPMFNSECGNVWGYEGSTGDVDWSWDYHIMINEFRRHPKVSGWLYTEHHDVINEWNGYWKYDRSRKFTGLEELVEGMKLNDLHSYIYLAPGIDLCSETRPGETVNVPVRLSVMTDQVPGGPVKLETRMYGWNRLGEKIEMSPDVQQVSMDPWEQKDLEVLSVIMPAEPGLFVYTMQLADETGEVLHTNFITFKVNGKTTRSNVISFDPASFSDNSWSLKQWNILDGLKVNGAGHGYFEYNVSIPQHMDLSAYSNGVLVVELSAKPLNGKDKGHKEQQNSDYMRGKGMHDPSQNPNSYPMTDEYKNPSKVVVFINGSKAAEIELNDDPADHRGILSWHAQPRDRKLREAGTYGYLAKVPIDSVALSQTKANGRLAIRFEVEEKLPGGLAIYGKDFGRYPLNPTIIFE